MFLKNVPWNLWPRELDFNDDEHTNINNTNSSIIILKTLISIILKLRFLKTTQQSNKSTNNQTKRHQNILQSNPLINTFKNFTKNSKTTDFGYFFRSIFYGNEVIIWIGLVLTEMCILHSPLISVNAE